MGYPRIGAHIENGSKLSPSSNPIQLWWVEDEDDEFSQEKMSFWNKNGNWD